MARRARRTAQAKADQENQKGVKKIQTQSREEVKS